MTEHLGPAPDAGVVGYYVHHVGRGHLHRATALATHLAATGGPTVIGLSSLPQPDSWPGGWLRLPRDDEGDAVRPHARNRLHWAPVHHPGLRSRMAAVSSWIEAVQPRALVVDVSVEVGLLARLHGVPVVSVVLPGRRDDPAHLLGFDIADELVAFWPPEAVGMLRGVPVETRARLRCLGALSRFAVDDAPRGPNRRRAVLLVGGGGHTDVPASSGAWEVTRLGVDGAWVDDPSELLREADVVVTHAGQNALAETAAARRPAVVVAQDRPHEEQRTTASALSTGNWPVVVLGHWPTDHASLDRAVTLDGSLWSRWCDGRAVERFGDVVLDVAGEAR